MPRLSSLARQTQHSFATLRGREAIRVRGIWPERPASGLFARRRSRKETRCDTRQTEVAMGLGRRAGDVPTAPSPSRQALPHLTLLCIAWISATKNARSGMGTYPIRVFTDRIAGLLT